MVITQMHYNIYLNVKISVTPILLLNLLTVLYTVQEE